MTHQEMPIFTRSFDLMKWVLQVTQHFPRVHRHTFTHRLLAATFDLRERLEEANIRRGGPRRQRLLAADEALARLRVYLRMAHQMGWLSDGQYGHMSSMTTEVGRLLGGWQKVRS